MTAATVAWNVVAAAGTTVTAAFGAAVAFLTAPVSLVVIAIAALIAIVVVLVKNWDTVKKVAAKVWESIKNTWSAASDWFDSNIVKPIDKFFSNMWDNLKTGASGAWEGIKNTFSKVTDWFKTIFTNAWQAVKDVFSAGGQIFSGIKEGIENTFKTVVNGLISGINVIISAPFKAINGMLNKIRSISVLGVSPFRGLWGENPLSIPQIPKLAKGGIIDQPTLAMVGERGKEAVMPLENNTGWINDLAKKIAAQLPQGQSSGGQSNQPIEVTLSLDELILGKAVAKAANSYRRQTGMSLLEV